MFLGLKYFYMNVHSWNECQLHRLPKAKGLGYSAHRCLEIHGVLSTVYKHCVSVAGMGMRETNGQGLPPLLTLQPTLLHSILAGSLCTFCM